MSVEVGTDLVVERESLRPSTRLRRNLAFAHERRFPVILGHVDAEQVLAEIESLRIAVTLLARLAADQPQFNSPLDVYGARQVRDAVLSAMANQGAHG